LKYVRGGSRDVRVSSHSGIVRLAVGVPVGGLDPKLRASARLSSGSYVNYTNRRGPFSLAPFIDRHMTPFLRSLEMCTTNRRVRASQRKGMRSS
jgi:hypothetical protein